MYNNIIIQIFYIKNNGVYSEGHNAGGLMTFGRLCGMIEIGKFEFVEYML